MVTINSDDFAFVQVYAWQTPLSKATLLRYIYIYIQQKTESNKYNPHPSRQAPAVILITVVT